MYHCEAAAVLHMPLRLFNALFAGGKVKLDAPLRSNPPWPSHILRGQGGILLEYHHDIALAHQQTQNP